MEYSEIMIRYAELSTKGKNKKFFINRLKNNVKKILADLDEIKVDFNHDRMYVYLQGEEGLEVVDRLTQVFGIQNVSPVVKTDKRLEAVYEVARELVAEDYREGVTFKITTNRADHTYEYDSMELNRVVGAAVIDAFPSIEAQMVDPDINVTLEVRQDGMYLFTKKYEGLGGLPVGTGGKAMLMLSGGIDSPVAGYLTQKRGVEIEAVHFHSAPYTSPQALQKAKDLTAKLSKYSGSIPFIGVPFTEIQEEIKKKVPDEYSMTVNRRFMMAITDIIREQRQGLAIVNGESIGQVASQTLESMAAINEVTTTPVLRPLVTMDKNEIIDIAKDIDTFELSVQPYEDCCTVFAPAKPKTRPELDKVKKFEEALDVAGLIERAIENITVEEIMPHSDSSIQEENIFSELL